MELPQMNKISFNTGLGLKGVQDRKQMLLTLLSMELITGQRPLVTRAKKSLDKFKLRKEMPVGTKVTLRGNLQYIFLDRFINIVIPSLDSSSELFIKRDSKQRQSEIEQELKRNRNRANAETGYTTSSSTKRQIICLTAFDTKQKSMFQQNNPISFCFKTNSNSYQNCLSLLRNKF
jgi:hypothetical protein